MSKFQKAFRRIGVAAALVLLPTWFYDGFLDNTYVNRLRQPHADADLTVPYHVKGITVYITASERQVLTWLTRLEIVSGAVLIVGLIGSGELHRLLRGEKLPK
jgi:hypothetical protein